MDSDADKQANSQTFQQTDADSEAEKKATSADIQPTTVATSEINDETTSPNPVTDEAESSSTVENNDEPKEEDTAEQKQPTSKKKPAWRQHFWMRYWQYLRRGIVHPSWSQEDKGLYFGFVSIVIISIFNAITATIVMHQLEEQIGYMRLIDPQLGLGEVTSGVGFFFKTLLLSIILYIVYALIGWILQYWVQNNHQMGYNTYLTKLMRQNSIILPLVLLMTLIAIVAASLTSVIMVLFILEGILAIIGLSISLYHDRHNESLDAMYVIILAIALTSFINIIIFRISMMPTIAHVLGLLLAS